MDAMIEMRDVFRYFRGNYYGTKMVLDLFKLLNT